MIMRSALFLVMAVCLGTSAVGCEKVSHENIDKWGHTEKGPGKLLSALESNEHSAGLRAHAAQILIEIGRFGEIKEVLETIEDGPRHLIMAELATRLWDVARINDAMSVPSARQTTAKDVLYHIIDLGDSATQAKVADYLVEWFVGGHYEGRATAGSVSGAMAIRRVGQSSAKRLLNSARAIVASPPDAEGRRDQVGPELLKALALSGSADVLDFMMQLVEQPRGDKTLPARVISAMFFAYVEPSDGLESVDGKVIVKIAQKLEAMYYDQGKSATMRNDAVALLGAMEANDCLPIFTHMISRSSDERSFRWTGTQQGVRCAGVQGIEAITEALPASIDYERGMLAKYLWDEILKFSDKKKIATAAVALLQSKSWVSRATGIELLGLLGKKSDVAGNISKIKALTGDSHRMRNWWGKQEDVPKAEKKPSPTLGELASNVAKSLETLASEGGGK